MDKPYWQLLLNAWRAKNRNGLTLPYLIGASYYFVQGQDYTIARLVNEMSFSIEYETYISYCTDIEQLIIGARTGDKRALGGDFLRLPDGEVSSFFITKIADDLGSTVEEVAASFKEKYQYYIDKQLYSRNDEEWTTFNDADIEFIKTTAGDYFL